MLDQGLVMSVLVGMTPENMEESLEQVKKYRYTEWLEKLIREVDLFIQEESRPPSREFYIGRDGVEEFMLVPPEGDGYRFALALLKKELTKETVQAALEDNDTDLATECLHEFRLSQRKPLELYTLQDASATLREIITSDAPVGVETGVEELDNALGGLTYGTVTVIGAMPGGGKTTLTLSAIYHAVVNRGMTAMVYWLEGRKQDLYYALVSRHSKEMDIPKSLNAADMKKGLLSEEDLVLYEQVATDLQPYLENKLFVFNYLDVPSWDMEGIKYLIAECEKYTEHPLDIIALDHLQRMAFYAPQRVDQTAFVNKFVASLGDTAETSGPYGRIVIITSQLNREAIKRMTRSKDEKTPDMAAFAMYSEIERVASYALILATTEEEKLAFGMGIYVVKNRHNPPVEEKLMTYADFAHFVIGGNEEYASVYSPDSTVLLPDNLPDTQSMVSMNGLTF